MKPEGKQQKQRKNKWRKNKAWKHFVSFCWWKVTTFNNQVPKNSC